MSSSDEIDPVALIKIKLCLLGASVVSRLAVK